MCTLWTREILKNWKVLPSDVDMYVPITINGVEKRYYINDDGTFIDDNSLSLLLLFSLLFCYLVGFFLFFVNYASDVMI